jgi:hypothetical protein
MSLHTTKPKFVRGSRGVEMRHNNPNAADVQSLFASFQSHLSPLHWGW